jgi:hypothetical protein
VVRRALIALLLVGGCSFERRTADYACNGPEDCGTGRTCDLGWCVEIGGPVVDADPNAPDADPNAPDASMSDAFACPSVCTSCDELNVCLIQCNTSDPGAPCNSAPIVCPPGVICKIGVDCSQSANCRVECTGDDSCAGAITCGEGPCHVECVDVNTCAEGIDCAASCSCFTDCSGFDACATPPTCPTGCEQGGECRNNQQVCSTCTG